MFPLTSCRITRTQGHSRCRAAASAMTLGAAALALLVGAGNFANAAENTSRSAHGQHACAVVMALRQPGDLYDTCIRSLDKTLSELAQARLVGADQRACAQEGLKPGTSTFSVCVVKAEQSPTGAAANGATIALH
jgi:hypothetical protein